MPVSPEVVTDFVTDGANIGKMLGVVAFIGAAVKGAVSVHENERGIRTRNGKVRRYMFGKRKGRPKEVEPGLHITFPPGWFGIKKIEVSDRELRLPINRVTLPSEGGDGSKLVHGLRVSVKWKVLEDGESVYNALFKAESIPTLKGLVSDICLRGFAKVCRGLEDNGLLYDSEAMLTRMGEECTPELGRYGVGLTDVFVGPAALTDAEIEAKAARENVAAIIGAFASGGASTFPSIGGLGGGISAPAS